MSRFLAVVATALVAACAASPGAATYRSVVPAAGEDGERHVRVTLKADGTASVSSAFTARPSRFLAEGTWQRDGRRITAILDDREWDRATWGEAGPGVLTRVQ